MFTQSNVRNLQANATNLAKGIPAIIWRNITNSNAYKSLYEFISIQHDLGNIL